MSLQCRTSFPVLECVSYSIFSEDTAAQAPIGFSEVDSRRELHISLERIPREALPQVWPCQLHRENATCAVIYLCNSWERPG